MSIIQFDLVQFIGWKKRETKKAVMMGLLEQIVASAHHGGDVKKNRKMVEKADQARS